MLAPRMADGFRAEMIKDTAEHVNKFFDRAKNLAVDVRSRWENGLSREDIAEVTSGPGTDKVETGAGALLRDTIVASYDTALKHYKPKEVPSPPPDGGP